MDKFEIVPYKQDHGKDMIAFGLNDKLMDYDATFEDNRIDFALAGLSYTLLCNSECVCSGGIVPLWSGVAQGWVISSKRIYKNRIRASRLIKKELIFFALQIKFGDYKHQLKQILKWV